METGALLNRMEPAPRVHSAAVAEVDAGQHERDWQAMSFTQLSARARSLETAAGFARTLTNYMIDANHGTAREALAALAEPNGNGDYSDGYTIRAEPRRGP